MGAESRVDDAPRRGLAKRQGQPFGVWPGPSVDCQRCGHGAGRGGRTEVLGHQEDAVVVLFGPWAGSTTKAPASGVDAGDAKAQRRACGGAEVEVGPGTPALKRRITHGARRNLDKRRGVAGARHRAVQVKRASGNGVAHAHPDLGAFRYADERAGNLRRLAFLGKHLHERVGSVGLWPSGCQRARVATNFSVSTPSLSSPAGTRLSLAVAVADAAACAGGRRAGRCSARQRAPGPATSMR